MPNACLDSDRAGRPGVSHRIPICAARIIAGSIVPATGSFASAVILTGALPVIGAAVSFWLTRHAHGAASPAPAGMARPTV